MTEAPTPAPDYSHLTEAEILAASEAASEAAEGEGK